jgi:predicted neuraminidase
MLASLLRDIKSRKCNSEKLIVFIIVILQRKRGVTNASDIGKHIANRMKAWSDGKFEMLVQDTIVTNEALLLTRRQQLSPEQFLTQKS